MEGISKIIGYKIESPFKNPEDRMKHLVDSYNDFEYKPAIERTFIQIRTLREEIYDMLKQYPELNGKYTLKNYGY